MVVSEPTTRKSYQVEVDQQKATSLIGKKVGEEFNGDIVGLNNFTLQITGGTDKSGFPMIKSVNGPGLKRILLKGKPGFHPKIKGQRKRKTIRGNTVSEDIMQINLKVIKGEKPLSEILGTKEKQEKPKKTGWNT